MHSLEYRAAIQIDGEDSYEFLQSILTNNINDLKKQDSIYALILTPQGKVIADCFCSKHEESIRMDLPLSQLEKIVKKFTMYKIGRKVSITRLDTHKIFISHEEGLTDPRIPSDNFKRAIKKAESAISLNLYAEYRTHLISSLIPEFTDEIISETFFPYALRMDEIGAINYSKGCYVGQEVTARVKYRGKQRKTLALLNQDDEIKNENIVNIYEDKSLVVVRKSIDE